MLKIRKKPSPKVQLFRLLIKNASKKNKELKEYMDLHSTLLEIIKEVEKENEQAKVPTSESGKIH